MASAGQFQRNHGDSVATKKSFLESAYSDPKFAPPLIEAATLEAAQGDWHAALEHSEKAIALNSSAFPDAYALNAMANVSLQNIEAAEKSAREGLKIDTGHQFPELEYSLGIVLNSKGDPAGALDHLYSYLKLAPNGPNADAGQKQLAEIKSAADNTKTAEVKDENYPSPKPVVTSEAGPSTALLLERNGPLLVKTPTHTCLETISREQIDTRGGLHDADLMHVEIAISDGKEIYGYADGRRFSSERLADMLGYTFSTTGLFSSIARALIAGNDEEIVYAGHGGWSIDYGKESGVAGERGSFWVGVENLILRRVVVYAVDIRRSLKLKELDAVIDYEPKTIAGHRVLLPYTARVHVQEGSGKQPVSRMFFNHCRAFTSDTTLSFDVNSTPVQSGSSSGRLELPPDINITVALSSPISLADAAANDLLTASVVSPVFSKGREIIARGAALEGHVVPCPGENAVIIELDRVRTPYGWAPFYARMVSPSAADHVKGHANSADPEIPGVAKIDFAGKAGELSAGTQMIWRTESLARSPEASQPGLNTAMGLH